MAEGSVGRDQFQRPKVRERLFNMPAADENINPRRTTCSGWGAYGQSNDKLIEWTRYFGSD